MLEYKDKINNLLMLITIVLIINVSSISLFAQKDKNISSNNSNKNTKISNSNTNTSTNDEDTKFKCTTIKGLAKAMGHNPRFISQEELEKFHADLREQAIIVATVKKINPEFNLKDFNYLEALKNIIQEQELNNSKNKSQDSKDSLKTDPETLSKIANTLLNCIEPEQLNSLTKKEIDLLLN